MKKTLAIFIALVMMMSAVACGNKTDNTSTPDTSTSTSTSDSTSSTTTPETPEKPDAPVATENLSLKFQNAIINAYSSEELKPIIDAVPVVSGFTTDMYEYLVSLETATTTNVDENKTFLNELSKQLKSILEQDYYNQTAPENPSEEDKEFYKELTATKQALTDISTLLENLASKTGEVTLELTEEQKAQLKLASTALYDMTLRNSEMLFGTLVDENGTALKPEDLEAYAMSMSMMMTKAHNVLVFKPVAGKEDFVYSIMEKLVENMQNTFKTYLQDQYEIAKAAKLEKLADGTIVLVMSEGGEEVYNSIMNSLK